jgi:predicted GH43/DUF377 family glycosyl hydrolase
MRYGECQVNMPRPSMLADKLVKASEKLTGIRRPHTSCIFKRILYIWPHWLRIRELSGREPFAAFNPGIILRGDKLLIFPRLIVGYFWYTSLVGYFELDFNEALEGKVERPIETRVVLYPFTKRDLAGCEDPRAVSFNGNIYILYTALEPRADRFHALNVNVRQGLAILDEKLTLKGRIVFDVVDKDGNVYYTETKDSALIKPVENGFLGLTRLTVEGVHAGWRGFFNLERGIIPAESLEPILIPEPWEYKVGWSTNVVQIGGDEYLVAWHGVGRDLIYRTGFAIVNGEGELLGITDYLLEPRTMQEFSGERPGVIFGCGLARKDELLIYVGGVADTGIGVYITELEKVMENVRWLKRS